MPDLFSLDAQRCGTERHARAEADGVGITVYTDGHPHRARSISDAIATAPDCIGEYLRPAERGGIPWGLRVGVHDSTASYGEWPLAAGGGGSASFQKTALVRIRTRWHGSGPLSALENAVQIIRAYAGRPGAHLAA